MPYQADGQDSEKVIDLEERGVAVLNPRIGPQVIVLTPVACKIWDNGRVLMSLSRQDLEHLWATMHDLQAVANAYDLTMAQQSGDRTNAGTNSTLA